jgi:hypothetical protein
MQKLEFSHCTRFKRYGHKGAKEVRIIAGDTEKMNDRVVFSQQNDKVNVEVVKNNVVMFNGDFDVFCKLVREPIVYIIPVSVFHSKLRLLDDAFYKELSLRDGTNMKLSEFNSIVKNNQAYTIENYFRIL